GPFRAIRWDKLQALDMQDRRFGWTVEMQAKAARFGYRVTEVPVRYRKRLGQSKITGSLIGSARAAYWIVGTLLRYAITSPRG
ncbi:MAG: glycosyltransferase family 2 protein, partial [Armatimonadetes bacterium]|nr:glycosyltransferase family 2 protein [Armatimonadota bacterium]